MDDAFLIGRVRLDFHVEGEVDARDDLSAAAFDADGRLWCASDELTGVHRLDPVARGVFAKAELFDLAAPLGLPADDDGDVDEIDIEGLDVADGALWIAGSHTSTRKKPKGKNRGKDISRLAEVKRRPNRYLLARVPLTNDKPAANIARLPFTPHGNALTEALLTDPHLGPFLHIHRPEAPTLQLASKENGFDIEGLAVHDGRVFLGLRGPVLRGLAALILEVEPEADGDGALALGPIGDDGRPYRKHFVELGGMGIRDLCWAGDDLLILAGPTLDLTGLQTVWRLRKAARLSDDSLTLSADKELRRVFDLPLVRDADKAEGIDRFDGLGEPGVLVVYDAPAPARKRQGGVALADVFSLPER